MYTIGKPEERMVDDMTFSEILKTRRTIRLYQQKPIPYKDLEDCVDAARLAPSARNSQPLEYIIVDSDMRKEMLSCMGFGGSISAVVKDYTSSQPAAYVAVLVNKELRGEWTSHDSGLAVESLILAAWEKGIGSCILGRINRDKIRDILKIPEKYDIDLVVALGYPAEKPVPEDIKDSPSTYRDSKGTLRVPKRPLKSILHRNGF